MIAQDGPQKGQQKNSCAPTEQNKTIQTKNLKKNISKVYLKTYLLQDTIYFLLCEMKYLFAERERVGIFCNKQFICVMVVNVIL